MMKKPQVSRVIIVAIATLLITLPVLDACTQASLAQEKPMKVAPIRWKFLSYGGETGAIGESQTWLAKEVEKRTGGRLVFDVYRRASLPIAKEQTALEVGAKGLVEMIEVWGAANSGVELCVELMAIPGFVPKSMEARIKLSHHLFPDYKELFAQKYNIYLYSLTNVTGRTMYLKGLAKTLDETKGLKVRAIGALETALSKRMGLTAVPMSWPDVYVAVQQGVLDGFWIIDSEVVGSKMYEVVKYIYPLAMGGSPLFGAINQKAFNDLPKDIQKILVDLQPAYQAEQERLFIKDTIEPRRVLLEKGMKVIDWPQSDLDQLAEMAKPVGGEWYQKANPMAKKFYDKGAALLQQIGAH